MTPIRIFLKRAASRLPVAVQRELKRWQYAREIRRGRFFTDEEEFQVLDTWIQEGDWVLDVGANIGHYAARMSSLVGKSGRVIAFEPVPTTFELLSTVAQCFEHENVTLLNVAASDTVRTMGMIIPKFETGLDNFYMARLTDDPCDLRVLTLPIDSLEIPSRVSLVKIDAEDHDSRVVSGMLKLIERDRPILIVETSDTKLERILTGLGYSSRILQQSSNVIYEAERKGSKE